MVLIEQITRRLCFALFALAMALSGFGMETAHAQSLHEAHSVHMEHALAGHGDHDAHADMQHPHQASIEVLEDHEGHADCAMAACCHTGGTEFHFRLSVVDGNAAIFATFRADQYSDAEKDRADKPPKHI